jgi:hypothetical protein
MIDIESRLGKVSISLYTVVEVHIGARALQVILLIWFGYIPRLSRWGEEGGIFYLFI